MQPLPRQQMQKLPNQPQTWLRKGRAKGLHTFDGGHHTDGEEESRGKDGRRELHDVLHHDGGESVESW